MGLLGRVSILIPFLFIPLFFKDDSVRFQDKCSHRLVKEFKSQIENELNLVCIGSGGSSPNDIESISLMFITYQPASINVAREITVEAVQSFLNKVNSCVEIRPYLRNSPFDSTNFDFSLLFFNQDNEFQTNEGLSSVGIVRGQIRYKFNNPETDKLETIYQEPFEEACCLVQKKQEVQHPPSQHGAER